MLVPHGMLCEPTAISETEELAKFMTFQVAMMASDGWVLASDTRAYDPYPMRVTDHAMLAPVMSATSKILYRADLSLIYSVFGTDSVARLVGSELESRVAAGVTPDQRREVLSAAGMEGLKRHGKPDIGSGLLVVFLTPAPQIWVLECGRTAIERKEFGFGGAGNLGCIYRSASTIYRPLNEQRCWLLIRF